MMFGRSTWTCLRFDNLRRTVIGVFIGCWVIVVSAGFGVLWHYSLTAGNITARRFIGRPKARFGAGTCKKRLWFSPIRSAHAARATMEELARIMSRCQNDVEVNVLFSRPAGDMEDMRNTALWDEARRIPGVHVETDWDGVEARRFARRHQECASFTTRLAA